MDYHQKQLLLHCRVCGKRPLVKRKQKKKKKKKKKECYECKAFAAEPDIAFNINTHTDNAQLHPERFSHCCHHSMQIFISTRAEGVHIAVHWHRFYIQMKGVTCIYCILLRNIM